jgi:Peptidase S46
MMNLVLAVVLAASVAAADEGMWLPEDWGKLPLAEQGVSLAADDWRGAAGVAGAIVNIGGGTGSFVSGDGLIITNHHVAYGSLQRLSSEERNYLADGFFAAARAEELTAPGTQVLVWLATEDVTARVLAATSGVTDATERYAALEQVKKELVGECETGEPDRCEVSAEYAGLQFRRHAFREIKDVRVVYAPPESIGAFGGDEDNWMWPRHAGDFAFLRAYVGPDGASAKYDAANVPYRPARFLEIDAAGVAPGEATVTAGYPYRTRRHLSSTAARRVVALEIPWKKRVLVGLIDIVESAQQENGEVSVRLAGWLMRLQNYYKKYQGIALGLSTIDLVGEKEELERQVLTALESRPEQREEFGAALTEIERLYGQENDAMWAKESVLSWLGYMSQTLGFALKINKWSIEQAKPDLEREPDYMERNRERARTRMETAQSRLHVPTDERLMVFMLKEAMALPAGQRIEVLDKKLGVRPDRTPSDADIAAFVRAHYAGTKLTEVEPRLAMLDATREDLLGGGDSFIALAVALQPEIDALKKRRKAFSGAMQKLSPQYIAGILAGHPGPHYPDANGTLRFSLGRVEGYAPRDGVWYRPQTTLAGMIAKHTGVAPFDAPEAVRRAYARGENRDFVNEQLGGAPVDFLSTNDVTGGNSGSPILSGAGKLVGLVFDTNFEAVASDIRYVPGINRTINVDVRYVLLMLEKVYPAPALREELGLSVKPRLRIDGGQND